ncbi:MAG: PRC-barrel domain-containing protein [Burkholderiales bacterium]
MRTVYKTMAGLVIAAGLMLAMPAQFAFSQAVELVVVDVKAVARGYRTSKLKGTNVTNDKNEKIGEIDDIIIGRDKVLFAILQVGGFLGLGAHLVAVPYQSLVIDDTGRKIQLPGASREALKKLQEFRYTT